MRNALTYNVTGRYMSGTEVTAYHLVDNNGGYIVASKEKTIYLAGRNLINNMRVQTSGDDVIIRGRGINLNQLPVYDTNKSTYRNTQNTSSNYTNLSMLKITKRVMYKNSCVGA